MGQSWPKLNGDVFNLLAIGLCLVLGEWLLAAGLAVLTGIGAVLEYRALSGQALRRPKPDQASEKLSIGDTLTISQGQNVPVDGVIIQGAAHLDQALLTGESKTIEKLVGDGVMAGSVVKAGRIKLRVTRTHQDSVIERIITLQENAKRHPASVERFAESLSGIFVVAMGLSAIAAWAFLQDLPLAIAILLLAGGNELATAMKLLIRTALMRSARRGLILKGGRWLEPLADLNALALEKAGLMTYADLHVGRLEHDPSISDAFVWECVAVAEKYSEHPAGRALFRMAAKHIGAMPDPDEFHVFPSKGVRVVLAGHEVMVGTAELLRAREISFDQTWLAGSTSPIEGTGSDIFVALDGACIARVRLQDRPRNDIRDSLQHLRELGVQTQVLFTSDTVRVAGAYAQAIGITDYRPTMKAEDTWHEVGRLAQQGTVALLGDNQQHAQAMVRADLGIVMGQAGRGLHTEAAGLVLLTDDLTHLPELIVLAREAKKIWKYLILYWIMVNIVAISLVLFHILGPLPAGLLALLLLRLPPLNAAYWLKKNRASGQAAQIARK